MTGLDEGKKDGCVIPNLCNVTYSTLWLPVAHLILMMAALEIFYITEQPTACPICGKRVELIADFMHTNYKGAIVECLNICCEFKFVETEKGV